MITDDYKIFLTSISPQQTIICLDLGRKTIGVAISDVDKKISSPLITINHKTFSSSLRQINDIILERDVGGIVIGLPLNIDGSQGPRCQSVRQFARNIAKEIDINITFYDERFSTVAAGDTLQKTGVGHKRRAELIDKIAASHILQNMLQN